MNHMPPDDLLTDDDIIAHLEGTYPQYDALSRRAKATGDYLVAVGRPDEASSSFAQHRAYAKIAAAEWRVLQVMQVLRDSGSLVGGAAKSSDLFTPPADDGGPEPADGDPTEPDLSSLL